ncbi:S16 family serine protease [Microbacterium sp.]|uniref:S16 family serine protease n=1 Tax=Microbacterium sp. TaxID=51671 RepID=UPI003A8C359B
MSRIRRGLLALALTATLTATAGCTAFIPDGGGSTDGGSTSGGGGGEITITWLAYNSQGGTTGDTTITLSPPDEPGDFRVEFSANEVGGIGGQAQAGAWSAAITATLLLGSPLEGEFSFETDGRVDGPSAGALTTAGIMALSRGDEFLEGVTMTGTINTTGTIGPVGGIPEKLEGAAEAGFDTVLIPLGQRNTPNADGETVDVVRAGERLGVDVIEVGDIYEAYEQLTGNEIAVPGVSSDPRLDNDSYDKVKPQADAAMARYEDAKREFERLPADMQSLFVTTGVIDNAEFYAARAEDLSRQGQQAGAFNIASQAAVTMEAIAGVGELLTPLYTQGLEGLGTIFDQATNDTVAEREFFAFLDRLSAYEPKSVADVEGLVNGFAGAFDAYSLLVFAQQEIATLQQGFEDDTIGSLEEFFGQLVLPVLWREFASGLLENADAVFEAGRDNPGAEISADVDIAQVGDFFRRGAEANYTAFEETIIAGWAEEFGMSNSQVLNALAANDLNVGVATVQQAILPAIADYVGGDDSNARYATMAYGLSNYARNQALMEKYYNNAILGDGFEIVGVRSDAVISRGLDLGRQQLAEEIQILRDGGTEPVISVASYEVAALLRNSDLLDKFEAISMYSGAFLTGRMMGYLSGAYGQG